MPTPRLTQHFQLANCLPNLRNLQTQQPEEEKKIESFWEVVLWTWLSGTLQRECNQAVPQDTNHFSFSIQNIFPKRRCCVFRKLDGCVSKSRRELEELNQENGGALSFLFLCNDPQLLYLVTYTLKVKSDILRIIMLSDFFQNQL